MEKNTLNVYCLGGPMLSTEWASIMGDKYRAHFDFEPVIVQTPETANVIVWDGVMTPKSTPVINDILSQIKDDVVFLITGEGRTFFQDHPFVKLADVSASVVFLPPSRVLPEELLEGLDQCRKLKSGSHV